MKPKSVVQTRNLVISEPNPNQFLFMVCRRGGKLFDIADISVRLGDVVAFVGLSGSGKTTLLRKIVQMMTPMEHKGRAIKRAMKDYAFAFQLDAEVDQTLTVSQLLQSLHKVDSDVVVHALELLSQADILEKKVASLLPK